MVLATLGLTRRTRWVLPSRENRSNPSCTNNSMPMVQTFWSPVHGLMTKDQPRCAEVVDVLTHWRVSRIWVSHSRAHRLLPDPLPIPQSERSDL